MKKNIIYVNFLKKKKINFISHLVYVALSILSKNIVKKTTISNNENIKKAEHL